MSTFNAIAFAFLTAGSQGSLPQADAVNAAIGNAEIKVVHAAPAQGMAVLRSKTSAPALQNSFMVADTKTPVDAQEIAKLVQRVQAGTGCTNSLVYPTEIKTSDGTNRIGWLATLQCGK